MTPPAPSRVRVTLVEDDDADALLVEDHLAERLPQARVTRRKSMREALAQIGEEDCVLLDLHLPDASGLEAVVMVRERVPEVALIVLTGLDDEAAGIAAVEAGAQDYLVKGSVDGGGLARSVRYAIGRRQAEAVQRQLRIAEVQSGEVARLERGLAPPPLVEDGSLFVASRYLADRSQALLGGDFYDAVEMPDGRLRAMLGDVCGHGPEEAAIGVSLRTAWRALALAGAGTQPTMDTLERVLGHESQLPGMFATLCALELDAQRGAVEVLLAGHPHPLLIEDGAAVALPPARSGPPVGLAQGRWCSQLAELPPRWSLLLYSDGLIEGRVGRGAQRLGEDGLRELLERYLGEHHDWRAQPERMLDWLIAQAEQLNGEPLSDDVALLAIGTRAA